MVKQFYLTRGWDPIRCYDSGQSELSSNGNEGLLQIPKALGKELHHQMQFSVISRTLFGEGSYPSAEM